MRRFAIAATALLLLSIAPRNAARADHGFHHDGRFFHHDHDFQGRFFHDRDFRHHSFFFFGGSPFFFGAPVFAPPPVVFYPPPPAFAAYAYAPPPPPPPPPQAGPASGTGCYPYRTTAMIHGQSVAVWGTACRDAQGQWHMRP